MKDIWTFISSLLESLKELFELLFETIWNGLRFFISSMTTIPLYIMELFDSLPSFFKVGLTGVFGLLIAVVILKIIAIMRTS